MAVLTIDSPPLNLFDQTMMDSLRANLSDLATECPRAVLIRADGRYTSAGVDVSLFSVLDDLSAAQMWRQLFDELIHRIEHLPCPVIFAAHGLTVTAAFEVALACDIIMAAPAATFGLIETTVGLTPSMGGPQRLAERAGSGRARELVMTGGLYDAETMKAWGVVNYVCDDLEAEAIELAHRLADGPTRAHAATKAIVGNWRSGGVAAADHATPDLSGSLFSTTDLKLAVANFLEHGPRHVTRYTGR